MLQAVSVSGRCMPIALKSFQGDKGIYKVFYDLPPPPNTHTHKILHFDFPDFYFDPQNFQAGLLFFYSQVFYRLHIENCMETLNMERTRGSTDRRMSNSGKNNMFPVYIKTLRCLTDIQYSHLCLPLLFQNVLLRHNDLLHTALQMHLYVPEQ